MARKFDIPNTYAIDSDTADRIAAHSLMFFYNCIVEDMDKFMLYQKGHPDDYERNVRLREAFELVLDFYGHSLYNTSIAKEKSNGQESDGS